MPLHDNEGKPFDKSTIDSILQDISLNFPGFTIVNCIGFSITIISIQLINILSNSWNPRYIYMLLAVGPILGILALYEKKPVNPIIAMQKIELIDNHKR